MKIGDDQAITDYIKVPGGTLIKGVVLEGSDVYSTVFVVNAVTLSAKHPNTIIYANYKKGDIIGFLNTQTDDVWVTYYAYDEYEDEDSKVKTIFELTLTP